MGPKSRRHPFIFFLTVNILTSLWFLPALPAQSSEQRQALREWEARLAAISDAGQLLQLLDSAGGGAERNRAMVQMRRGLAEYRLGLATHNRRYFDDALDDFWNAAEEEDWPYPWYGLGTTKLAMAAERFLPYAAEHQPSGSSYAEEAGVALNRAVEIDPKFELASSAYRGAVDSSGSGGDAVLGLARRQRESGHRDSAIALYRDFLRVTRDSGIALLELAPLLAASERHGEAVETYYAGASRIASLPARAELRANIAWVADSAELQQFDRIPPDRLRPWLEGFWERRDVRDTRRPGERLVEHLRRLDYAEREFRRVSDHRRYTPGQAYQSEQTELDDRAVIYIRHGEPDDRAAFTSAFASNEAPASGTNNPDQAASPPPNVSWKYRRPDGNLIFHFVSHLGNDYKLIESLLDVFSLDTVLALQLRLGCRSGRFYSLRDMHRVQACPEDLDGPPLGPAHDAVRFVRPLIASRSELDPVYGRLALSSLNSGSVNFQREREAGQRSIAVGTTSDSYLQHFGSNLEPMIQAYGVSRENAGKILLVFGIPRQRLEKKAGPDFDAGFPIAVRLVLSTEADQRQVQVDTVSRLVAQGARGKDGYFAGYLELPAPVGLHRARVLVVDQGGDAGGVSPVEEVAVPTLADDSLSISDLVLGKAGSLSWTGPEGPVLLHPLGVFAPGSVAHLSYQVGGLVVGATYRTRIAIRSTRDPKGTGRTASEFAQVAREATRSEQRDLSLTGVRPGEYILTLAMSGPGGTVSRSTRLRVK